MDQISIFDRLRASFVRDSQGNLAFCDGPATFTVREHWQDISHQLQTVGCSESLRMLPFLVGDQAFQIYEKQQQISGTFKGIILSPTPSQVGDAVPKPFERFFVDLILNQIDFALASTRETTCIEAVATATTAAIVGLFDSFLRYVTRDDQWNESGRAYFADRVQHFTSQGLRIEFCLPAFPCKSSNMDKVTGKDPDRGEELALTRLHDFVAEVEKLYAPGAEIWIISDGHVFSDCIGVDDATVDTYGDKLKEMNDEIEKKRGNPGRVGFKSLLDLFALEKSRSEAELSDLGDELQLPILEHHVPTTLTQEAELCRRILTTACQPPRSDVRAKIEAKDPAILGLYRGFNKFMAEDLRFHPMMRSLSKKKQKTLFSQVAFEMIVRNQAYSNLVEMLFPNTVRLSIHAHNNAGPKFGIQLFDPFKVRAVKSLDSRHLSGSDNLHIPTPWHNCIVKMVDADELLLVTKASVVRDALVAQHVELVDNGVHAQKRTSFVVRRRPVASPDLDHLDKQAQESEAALFPPSKEKQASEVKPAPLQTWGAWYGGPVRIRNITVSIFDVLSKNLRGRATTV